MFPADVPQSFSREYGFTLTEWLRDLPRAAAGHAMTRPSASDAHIALPAGGQLQLAWAPLPPRQIALVRFPRLRVDFRFEQADDQARRAFMRHFDLSLQRGGG